MQVAITPAPAINWSIVRTIIRRELRDSMRDWRIVGPVMLLTLGFPFLMNLTARVVFNFLAQYNATIIGEQMIPFGILVVGFFPMTFSLVIALETFVGERERNSLEALFATPATDMELYFGKLLAALLLPLMASLMGIALYTLGIWYTRGWLPDPLLLIQIVALTIMEGLVMVTGAVVLSSHTTSVRAANLLASFIIVPMALLLQVEAVMMFWRAYNGLWFVALGLAVVDAIMIRAGLYTFNRESILSRELDHLNLRWLVNLWLAFFMLPPKEQHRALLHGAVVQQEFSLRRIYTEHVPQLLRRVGPAIGATTVALVGGVLLGLGLAPVWPIPDQLLGINDFNAVAFRERLARGTPGWNMLPEFSPLAVFSHNIRALLLAAMLGVLSFGSLAILLLVVPMGVVGFLMGQFMQAGQDPWRFLAAFILPHGIVEIPAAILATACALRMGAVMIAPPPGFTAGEGLIQATADFAKVFVFVIAPLLLVAALLEVYVTPEIVILLYGN